MVQIIKKKYIIKQLLIDINTKYVYLCVGFNQSLEQTFSKVIGLLQIEHVTSHHSSSSSQYNCT